MSYSVKGRVNKGACERPFSGVGIEFYPLGVEPGRSGVILHESGYLPDNRDWNYLGVFSPFWRLYYNSEPGHCVLFGDEVVELTPDRLMLIPEKEKERRAEEPRECNQPENSINGAKSITKY